MAFDLSTARPVTGGTAQASSSPSGGFDLSTARPNAQAPQDKGFFQTIFDVEGRAAPDPRQNLNQFTVEPTLAVATSIPAEIAAGVAGIAQTLNPFAEQGAGARAVESTREALTLEPRTEIGKAALGEFGQTLAPVGEAFQSAEQAAGDIGFEIAGPVGGAIGAAVPTAIGEALGVGLAKGVIKVPEAFKAPFTKKSKLKEKVAELLEKGSTDRETAGFELKDDLAKDPDAISSFSESVRTGADKVQTDKVAVEAIKQGFDEGVIATVKGSSKKDKKKMLGMVGRMERGKKNAREAALNRPSDIAGETVKGRFDFVLRKNKEAGKQLEVEANKLKGRQVEFTESVDSFLVDLEGMGITVGPNLKPNFRGSDIEGSTGAENVIKKVVDRMANNVKAPDAFELHRLKKFIDEQVTFGKAAEGLTGQAERVLKSLRRSIDGALDKAFPSYDAVNTQYADTIGALDSLQDVAGRKMNLIGENASKSIGTLTRRLLSNAQSRITLLDSINEVERVGRKYGGKFDDDVISQVLFVDELDALFGPVARTSLQGQGEQIARRTAQAATSKEGAFSAAVDVAGKGVEKLRGINEEAAFKAIKELLKK